MTDFAFVYVLGPDDGPPVKVGWSGNPLGRLAALQTASPTPLHLHGAVEVPRPLAGAVERRAHRLLADAALTGEWFDVDPGAALAAVRAALAEAGADPPAAAAPMRPRLRRVAAPGVRLDPAAWSAGTALRALALASIGRGAAP